MQFQVSQLPTKKRAGLLLNSGIANFYLSQYEKVIATLKESLQISQEFTSVWNTALSSPDNQIIIPTNPALTYDYVVDWGDGNTDTGITGNATHTYAAPGIYEIRVSGSFPAIYFNNAGDTNKIIEITSWGNIQWQSMENAFYRCVNLNFDAISASDLSQVTSLRNMFRGATIFNGILNNWNVSSITDISGMFQNCEIFNRPLDSWTTNNIIDMSNTFNEARDFNQPLTKLDYKRCNNDGRDV